jgi:putative DNA primase/helicase
MNKISTKRKQLQREFEEAKAAKVKPRAIEPTYPARNEMPVEQARERVAADFKHWLQKTEGWWQRNPPKKKKKKPADEFERFARGVKKKKEPPPVHAQRSPTGVGKTRIGAKEIAADRLARKRAGDTGPMATLPYEYFGPTHRLNEDTAKQFREAGLTAKVYRGRFALDPNVEGNEQRPEKEQVLMCLTPERVKRAMSLYQSISDSCCKSKKQECPFFNQCAFQRQLRGEQPDVWLAAHEMLFHDQKILNKVAGVIIDETFYQDGLSGIEEPREALTLDDIAVLGDGVDDPQIAIFRKKLFELLSEHPLGGLRRDHFVVDRWEDPRKGTSDSRTPNVTYLLHETICSNAIKKEWKIFDRVKITPGMTEEQIEALKGIIPDCIRARRMVGVWGALRELVKVGPTKNEKIEISGRLVLVRNKDGQTILRIRGVRPILEAREVPSMLLDATLPSKLILQKFYPQVDVVSDVQVEMPHVRVKQVLGAPVSQNNLWGTEEEPSKGNNLHRIRRYILQRWLEIGGPRLWTEECQRELDPKLRRMPMVVICQKEVRLWLQDAETKHKWYWKVPRPGIALPEGIALEHYNAIAGLDLHKSVRLLVTIGRTLPRHEAVEAIAGALTGKQPALEAPTGRGYGKVPRAIRMADGTSVEVLNCDQHVDETAEAIRLQICEAELVQAIGRGRGVIRTAETPLDVDIVSDVVVPITEDEVVQWETPSELVEMPARDGIVLTAPADMARAWPSVWKTAERARWMLRKLGAKVRPGGVPTDQAVSSLYGISLIGKTPLDATFIYRRAIDKAHLAISFFDPRQRPNPAVWLREKQGELAERLHYLWQPHEIPPLAGNGKVKIDENQIWILVRETLDQLFDRAAKHPWRKLPEKQPGPRYALSADVQQHKVYAGAGRPGRYTLSKDAMTAYDGAPGGITTPHCLNAAVTPKLPWSTPVVEEITDPAAIAAIRAAVAAQDAAREITQEQT